MHVKLTESISYDINLELDRINIQPFRQILQHPQISHEQAHHLEESSGPCMQLHPGHQKQTVFKPILFGCYLFSDVTVNITLTKHLCLH